MGTGLLNHPVCKYFDTLSLTQSVNKLHIYCVQRHRILITTKCVGCWCLILWSFLNYPTLNCLRLYEIKAGSIHFSLTFRKRTQSISWHSLIYHCSSTVVTISAGKSFPLLFLYLGFISGKLKSFISLSSFIIFATSVGDFLIVSVPRSLLKNRVISSTVFIPWSKDLLRFLTNFGFECRRHCNKKLVVNLWRIWVARKLELNWILISNFD